MSLRALLDFFFPAQCASCNVFGSGLCTACAPVRVPAVHVRLGRLVGLAYGTYEGALRTAILALKDGRRDVAEALGERIAHFIEPGSLLVPIPTSARRLRARGMDGVALIARTAATTRNASVLRALVQYAGDAQRGRTRGERLAARGRFRCEPSLVEGRSVVLIDDVCTTGATIGDCKSAVERAGGTVTGAVVVAATKTPPPWKPPSQDV